MLSVEWAHGHQNPCACATYKKLEELGLFSRISKNTNYLRNFNNTIDLTIFNIALSLRLLLHIYNNTYYLQEFFQNTNYCRPCHCFTEREVTRTGVQEKSTKLRNSLISPWPIIYSTTTTSTPNYCIKYIALNTIISSGYNYVWQYFVSLSVEMESTFMKCSMFKTYIRQYCAQYLVLHCCGLRTRMFLHSIQ